MKFKGGCDLRILCDSNHKINKNIAGAQAHNSISFFVKLKDVGEKRALRLSKGQKFALQNMIKIINNLEEVNYGLILGPNKPKCP